MSSAAARPTAVTSSCDRGSPRPAARFVTRLTPATRTPRWRRAIVSHGGGHAHQVGADGGEHADLGRRLVARAGQRCVDALGHPGPHRGGQVPQLGVVRRAHVDEGRWGTVVRTGQRVGAAEVHVIGDAHQGADGEIGDRCRPRRWSARWLAPRRRRRPARRGRPRAPTVPRRGAPARPAPARRGRRAARPRSDRRDRPRPGPGSRPDRSWGSGPSPPARRRRRRVPSPARPRRRRPPRRPDG